MLSLNSKELKYRIGVYIHENRSINIFHVLLFFLVSVLPQYRNISARWFPGMLIDGHTEKYIGAVLSFLQHCHGKMMDFRSCCDRKLDKSLTLCIRVYVNDSFK